MAYPELPDAEMTCGAFAGNAWGCGESETKIHTETCLVWIEESKDAAEETSRHIKHDSMHQVMV